MSIKLRLMLATAALIGVVIALNVAHYVAATVAVNDARVVGNRNIPELLALQDMRFGVLEIIESTIEQAFIAVTQNGGHNANETGVRQNEDGDALYTEALRRHERYRPIAEESDYQALGVTLPKAYAGLISAADELIVAANHGIDSDEIVAIKEAFEERGHEILKIIDSHLIIDSGQAETALQEVIGKIEGTQRFALAMGGIALASFLVYWIFVFNMIRKLATARDRATVATRAKSAFLSNMSHELRTPMNAIIGFAQMLGANPKERLSDTQRECVRHITNAGSSLTALIDKILLFSEIEDGKIATTPERTAIQPMIQDCLDVNRRDATERGVKLIDMVADNTLPEINIDPNLFKNVLLALLANAIAYNRNGGDVTVRAEAVPKGWLRISVIDTGLGITRDKQDDLFKPFHRLGIVHSNIGGSGVGLAVAKDLTRLMGGRIGFESEAGQGSTFWVEFPITGG